MTALTDWLEKARGVVSAKPCYVKIVGTGRYDAALVTIQSDPTEEPLEILYCLGCLPYQHMHADLPFGQCRGTRYWIEDVPWVVVAHYETVITSETNFLTTDWFHLARYTEEILNDTYFSLTGNDIKAKVEWL